MACASDRDFESKKRLVIVLGMHRSGTSALTRALPIFGIDLGSSLMPAVAGDNDKGFWEDLDVNALNDEVIAALGSNWDSLGLLPATAFECAEMQPLRERAADLVRAKMTPCNGFGIKDPRLSLLVAFWKPVFAALRLKVVYLLAVRNPMSVVRSLRARNGFEEGKSYRMWMEHVLGAIAATQGEKRLCVDFDELVLDPWRQLRRIGVAIGLNAGEARAREYVVQFLDEQLRHTRFFIGDLENEPGAPAEAPELYWLMRRVAVDDRLQAWSAVNDYLQSRRNGKAHLSEVDRIPGCR
jgi:hypothetical protein